MSKADKHQDELSDAMASGGGCIEAWEASQEIRLC
jgi:hypothetical protein